MTTLFAALYIVEPSNNDNIVSGPCIKLGFIGVYIILLIFAQKHGLWVSLEPSRRGVSYEYPQPIF